MGERRYMFGYHVSADHSAGKPCHAPHAMERCHDATPVKPLHTYALGIERYIGKITTNTKEQQCQSQLPRCGNAAKQQKHCGIQAGGDRQYPAAAEPAHQET